MTDAEVIRLLMAATLLSVVFDQRLVITSPHTRGFRSDCILWVALGKLNQISYKL